LIPGGCGTTQPLGKCSERKCLDDGLAERDVVIQGKRGCQGDSKKSTGGKRGRDKRRKKNRRKTLSGFPGHLLGKRRLLTKRGDNGRGCLTTKGEGGLFDFEGSKVDSSRGVWKESTVSRGKDGTRIEVNCREGNKKTTMHEKLPQVVGRGVKGYSDLWFFAL